MKGLLLDTNLLCLLVVGLIGTEHISKHKRLAAYGPAEFAILLQAVSAFPSLILTPQIYAETSNLLRQTADPLRSRAAEQLKLIARETIELNLPTSVAVDRPEYIRLGITDSVILILNAEDCALLSDDLNLYLAAASAGYPAINFNYLRDGAVSLEDFN